MKWVNLTLSIPSILYGLFHVQIQTTPLSEWGYFFMNQNILANSVHTDEIAHFNPFTPTYLTWNLPFSLSDQSVYHKIKFRPVHSNSGWWFCFFKYGRILANSADPDETARMSRLIWIYSVCKPWPLQRSLGLSNLILIYTLGKTCDYSHWGWKG